MRSDLFEAADPIMVRLASLPVGTFEWDGHGMAIDAGPQGSEQQLSSYIERLASNPVLKEAIMLASPSLVGTLVRIENGERLEPRKLLKVAVSLTKYAMRISGRPTPFGLFAGVVGASFGTRARAVVGDRHRKAVRPDAGWFNAVFADALMTTDLLLDSQVVLSDLCYVRGDQLYSPWARATENESAKIQEVSIRLTPLVERIRQGARQPVACKELISSVAQSMSLADLGPVERAVKQLVGKGFLLTSIAPRHVDVEAVEALGQQYQPDSLGTAARALAVYADAGLGHGTGHLRSALDALQAIQRFPRPPMQVDLRIDADISLPVSVGESLEGLAADLWRMSPGRSVPEHMREYTAAFTERYGYNTAVGVQSVLDPHDGLGLPAGYKGSTRSSGHHHSHGSGNRREDVLAGMVQQSLMKGCHEIVLDEQLIQQLTADQTGKAEQVDPPANLELCVHLVAGSTADIDNGDFQLVMSRYKGSQTIGATFGRFAALMGVTEALQKLVDRPDGSAKLLQLRFEPNSPRHLNVNQVPDILPDQLPIGVFPAGGPERNTDWRDLALVADHTGLHLVSRHSGERVVPRSLSALGLERTAPDVARFLVEVASTGMSTWRPWTWGGLDALPFLPRVCHGRVIVSPAQWRMPLELTGTKTPWHEWEDAFREWRELWKVPRHVQIASWDETCALDLDNPMHRMLLRQELGSHEVEVFENLAAHPDAFGWSANHANELVVPLRGRTAPRHDAPPPAWGAAEETPAPYAPGSEWLYAKIYATPDIHNTLLSRRLPAFLGDVAEHIDRWFYIRYRDPNPHLRLRLHGDPRSLTGHVLPALHSFLSRLQEEHLIGTWVLDQYIPETQRYGGPSAIRQAEDLFALDSSASVYQISARAARRIELPDEVLAAANYAIALESLGDWDWCQWANDAYPNSEEHRRYFRSVSKLAHTWIKPGRALEHFTDLIGSPAVHETWSQSAARTYGDVVLSGLPAGRRDHALRGILHMQHNRLIGISPENEDRSYAVLRGIARDEIGRRSHKK
ncbi:lantibiotic dehydratase [Kitasatospora sp. NPDC059747]|uniref:lantibiotic dehydratase n=1 Tax=Kitasatospora sp. NPDC059747 TaxID=3346930 RepID=UPI00365E0795